MGVLSPAGMMLQLPNAFDREVALLRGVDIKEEKICFRCCSFCCCLITCHNRLSFHTHVQYPMPAFFSVLPGVPPADRRISEQVPLHPRLPEQPDDRVVREADRHALVVPHPRGARFVAVFNDRHLFWSRTS